MRVLPLGGAASTHTARLLHTLGDIRGGRGKLKAYLVNHRMPTVDDDKRAADDHMRCFSGELVISVLILMTLLQSAVVPRNLLLDSVRCYSLLVRILQICTVSPRRIASVVDMLRAAVEEHHKMQ